MPVSERSRATRDPARQGGRARARASAGRSARGPFGATFRLGRVAGIEIGVNWTWLLVFGLIAWSLGGVEFPAAAPGRNGWVYAAMGLVATALFFASLVLHELGHALRARREQMRIEGITLWLFGGVAQFSGAFPSAGAEFRVAIAGPLVSLALGLGFAAAGLVWPSPGALQVVLSWLGYINLALLVFNMLPALPLDGGRVLRAALWSRGGDLLAATHRATRVGGAIATALIVLGFLETLAFGLGGLWLAAIGWFVLQAGRAEERAIATRGALGGILVDALMTRAPVTVAADDTLAECVASLRGEPRHTAYPAVEGGAVVGLLPLRALAATPPQRWDDVHVRDRLLPLADVPLLTRDTPATDAAETLAASSVGRGLVFADGELIGILSLTDVARAIALGRVV
jgi:Zn-dependent protease/CBS domain-containing protein